MKFEIVVYYILKIFGYLCGFAGAFGVIGFAGSHECGNITDAQFWIYEIRAFALIGLCGIVYYIRNYIRDDVIRRNRIMKIKAKINNLAK
jgi:hypothetical protein